VVLLTGGARGRVLGRCGLLDGRVSELLTTVSASVPPLGTVLGAAAAVHSEASPVAPA